MTDAMSESKKKCRQYSVDYLKFGFIPSLPDNQSPMCLLCNNVLGNAAMKPSKLQDHLRRCYPDKTEKDLVTKKKIECMNHFIWSLMQ
ncbi:unnamed protein product [Acanthoscelides obtectus]|uniref:Uncharacterized protein n=1 Tax=Acanthoscelides obtectus TaxID=200917 RepID=A0A9P0M3Q1_ACAOB|nr:unnamed protein product [Acanthoscelides obtectus]CAK1664661.1 Protein FAM200B [Acanthoscelides obtectus]